jgi:hypothetical protein
LVLGGGGAGTRRGPPRVPRGRAFLGVLAVALPGWLAQALQAQPAIGSGQFEIIGTGLDVSPEAQAVPLGVPTRVDTHLPLPPGGRLPPGVTVRGELNGPGLPGTLALSAEPNGFFTIPAETVRGTYVLSDIRLQDGDAIVAYSAHRDATITVTDLLLTQVTSRPLTYQEMVDKGIVVSPKDFRGYNFSFAITIQSNVVQFDVPVVFPGVGPPILPTIPRAQGRTPPPEAFPVPQVRDIELKCTGYCPSGSLDFPKDPENQPVQLPGLLVIPGDVAFLNQFFSVLLLLQNGAPAGSNLQLTNVTAKATMPAGLRAAETRPPTNLSDPVPVVDPGPDGKLGTADDVTFLMAQSVGRAEFLVEGLNAGRYEVPIDLTATLQGLPTGPMTIQGTTSGVVLVRNPSFFVTLDHPDVVRDGEDYTLSATLANTSSVPANQVSIRLDPSAITGAQLLSPDRVDLGDLAAGDSALAKFQMKALRTGRVTSTAFIGEGAIAGAVVLSAGVGELSAPLSPDTLVYPKSLDNLPPELLDPAKRLIGLAWGLAHSAGAAPPPGLAPVGEQATRWRVDDLIRSSRHADLGEAESTALSDLVLGWLNAGAERSTGFDLLRRSSAKGSDFAAAWGGELTRFWQSEAVFDFQRRIARSLPDRFFLSAALSEGSDPANPSARLVVAGKAVGGREQLFPEEDGYERSLPSADLFRAEEGGSHYELAWLGGPDPGGYQLQIAGKRSDTVTLTVTYPGAGGKLVFVTFGPFPVAPGSIAMVDIFPGADPGSLFLQGTSFAPIAGVVQVEPRPDLTLVAAVQDLEADPRGHAVSLLFNRAVGSDGASRDPGKYEVRSEFGVNAVQAALPQGADARLVVLGVTNHPSPYATITVRATQLSDADGRPLAPDPQVVALVVRDRTPGGSVEGFVLGASGKPVANAEVVLRMPTTSDVTGQTFLDDFAVARADGSGHFFFEFIPIRQGTVFTLAAADPATGYDGDAAGQIQTEGQRLQLNIVLLARGDVGGRVLDETGTAIPNAYITADSVFFKGERNSATGNSAADGTYLFQSLPVGPVQLWAIDPASRKTAYQTAFIPAAGARASQDIVLVVGARASVSGQVLREKDASAAAGVYVVAYGEPVSVPYPPGTDRKYLGYRITDANGQFAFDDIQPGQDTIQVFDFTRSLSPVVERAVTVLPDSQTVLQLVIPEPEAHAGSVAGVVRSSRSGVTSPLANAIVYVSGTPARTTTDASGAYRLDGVPVGPRGVTAYDPATQRFVSGTVLVQEGLTAALDLTFVATANLSGVVLDPLDRFVPNAAVAEFDAAGNIVRSATADGSGRFVVQNLPPGAHTFFGFGQDDASGSLRDDIGSASLVFAGTQDSSITIRFAGFGSVRGRVLSTELSPDGQPFDSPVGAHLVLEAPKLVKQGGFALIAGPGHPLYPGPDEADSSTADGSYSFDRVLGGSFALKVHHPLFGDQTVSGAITRDGQVATEDFRYQGVSSIDGFLYDEKGNPVGGVPVDLWSRGAPATRDDPVNPPFATVQTVSDPADPRGPGYFRFAAVGNGDWAVTFIGAVQGVHRFDETLVSLAGSPHSVRVTLRVRAVQDVRVHVFEPDASGEQQPVPLASVSIRETDWPGRSFRADTGPDGTVLFPGISEGRFAVNAQSLARKGSAGGCVCEDGGVADVTVLLSGSGSVRGTVRFPGTGAAVPSAQVLVTSFGFPVAAAQTDASGQYRVDGLALNQVFAVRVKDNASARFGFSPSFVLSGNGDEAVEDVTLLALGFVDGTFSDSSGARPIAGATVTLTSDSLLGTNRFLSGTDGRGLFSFGGIPQGTFSLLARDALTNLAGTASGEIATEGQTVTVDLRAQASGTVEGVVEDSAGAALAVAPTVSLAAPGMPAQTAFSASFSFENVPVGVAFTVTADEQVSPPRHRAVATGSLSQNGEVQNLVLRYVPYGDVTVWVVRVAADGSQAPAGRGSVSLVNLGVYPNQLPFGYPVALDAAGTAHFSRVGGGPLRAVYYDPANNTNTAAEGTLATEGESLEILVQVFDTSTVSGRVVQPPPNAALPAPGTFVTLVMNNLPRTAVAAADGTFSFDGVPFQAGRLEIRSDALPGRAVRTFTLGPANAPLDLGDIVLDGAPPFVGSFSPPAGASGVPRDAALTAVFSEPVTVADGASFQAVAADHVRGGHVALAGDRRTATWTPDPPLLPNTAYTFRVGPGAVVDDAGWNMASAYLSAFTTINDAGPSVVQTAPSANAVQVPVATSIAVVFDTDLDPASLVPGAIAVSRTVPSAAAVPGAVAPGGTPRTAVFTPASALDPEARYEVAVSGVKSALGLPMYAPYVFPFWTRDDTAPAVTFEPPPASPFVTNATYTLGLDWTANDVRTIEVRANGALVATLKPALPDRSASFAYFVGTDPSTRVFSATPTDYSGNVGAAATLTVPVAVDQPPTVSIAITSPTLLLPGQAFTGRVVGADDRGLSELRLYASGPFSAALVWTDVAGQLSASRDFSLVVPISAAAGGPVTLRADAFDDSPVRQQAEATNVSVSVLRDAVRPVVANVSPASGTSVVPGSTVLVSADVTDDVGIRGVSLDQPGAQFRSLVGNRYTLAFTAPTGTADFTATLTALDYGGNAASAPILFHLLADQPPSGSIAFSPAGPVLPDAFLYAVVDASDDHALKSVVFRFTGAVTDTRTVGLSGVSQHVQWQEKVPLTAAAGALITATADILDAQGHTITVGPVQTTVAADTTPPVLSNARPPDGSQYVSGNAVTVGVDASDDVAVASVDITVDGAKTTLTSPPYQISYTAKAVVADTAVPIHFAARDLAGNTATLDESITISSNSNPNAPTAAFLCPTTGALFPAGYTLAVSAFATDDQAVQRVEFSVDDGPPFATVTAAPYTAAFTIPVGTAAGTALHLRARAFDFGNNVGIADAVVMVVAGTVISSDTAIFAGTTAYDGQTLIVTGGTLTIAGSHPFGDMVVLNGARVTSDATTQFTASELDLSRVSGRVYVGCGGAIDVSAKGYLGGWQAGNPSASGVTTGNTAGSAYNTGGSYGGQGGVTGSGSSGAPAPPYGDLASPAELGSGGGGSQTCCFAGGNGGGRVRIDAASVVVDGAIAARGGEAGQSGGSGGSIRIDAAALSGAGTVDASGGGGHGGGPEAGAGGGGGRVAVYGDASAFDRSRFVAHGGPSDNPGSGSQSGGSGTVYLKGPASTDGDLLLDNGGVANAAQTRLVPQGSAYRFDTVTARNRSKGASTDDVLAAFTVDATSYFATPSRDSAPTVTVTTSPAGTVPSASNLTITVVAGDDNALGKVDLSVAGDPSFSETRRETDTSSKTETYTLFIPGTTPAGTLDITATVTDEPFGRTSTATTSVTVDADFPPSGTLSFDAGGPFLPGKNVTITVAMADDRGLNALFLTGTSSLVFFNPSFVLSGTSATRTYTFTIPVTAPAGHQINVTATIRDTKNQTTTLTGTITVAADVTPPILSNPRPADGASFHSGDPVAVGVDVTDDVAVASVDITVDGATTTVTSAPYQITYPAKSVAVPTSVPIQFVARDLAGNSSSLSETITVDPAVDPGIPKVSWACPTTGALLPPGAAITLTANASDDQAVQKVEFYEGAAVTPFATDTTAPYQAAYTVSGSLADGDTVTLRAKVYDFANNTAEATAVVTVVQGDVISATATISAADTSHDGHTVIVTGGTTTIDGPHSFARLVVLSGAKVTQVASAAVTPRSLNLSLPGGTVYVACGGAIDVTGKGFPANQTWNGALTSCGGSFGIGGGAYGGVGGSCLQMTYGSLFDPKDPGANGGGGAILLSADRAIVDGLVAADGQIASFGGSGGTVRLDLQTLSGSGTIRAAGGNATFSGSGGGGRIAVFYGDMSGFDRAHALAPGGGSINVGSAGTVLFKSASQTYGELVLDNNGINAAQATVIPFIGTGTVSSVSGSSFTKSSGAFFYSVEGVSVDVRRAGALVGRFRALSSNGATLTLDTPIQGVVQAGDTFQGVLKLDNLVIASGVKISTSDFLEGFDNPPTGSLAVTSANPILPGKTISVTVTAADDYGIATIVLHATGAATSTQTRGIGSLTSTQVFSVPVPVTATAGSTVQLTADIVDAFGQTTTVGPATVTIAADVTPPVLSNPTPPDGSRFASTRIIAVSVTATDDVGVLSVDITVDGVTTTKASPPYTIVYTAKVVAQDTPVPIQFVARDRAGNTATLDETIIVHPDEAPSVSLSCPSDGALLPAGYVATVTADAVDDLSVTKVEFYANGDSVPFATDATSPYQAAYTVPAGLSDGDTFTLTARAYDSGGHTTDATSTVAVAAGDVISSSTTIAAGDATYDGHTVIVSGGTTTIDGPHTFARLIVLSGATVTQSASTSSAVGALTLTTTGETYVTCGGSLDVSGKGYLGGNKPGNPLSAGRTLGNVAGSTSLAGGSSGGRGARATSAPVFGDLFDPRDAGGGGAGSLISQVGGSGGGIVRLVADQIVVDGSVLADGESSSTAGGGAGGSIRLDAAQLSGGGVVRAVGGSISTSSAGCGGAGRVAAYYGAASPALPTISAQGVSQTISFVTIVSGAGTALLKSDAEAYGHLVADGPAGAQATVLPAIGSGTVSAVAGSTITNSSTAFPYAVAGLFVEITRGVTVIGTYRVLDQSGGTLTLDTPVDGVVLPGDAYQGVLRLDAITVRGGALVSTADRLDCPSITVDTANGSSLTAANYP